ncbi:hypothetical protein QL285_044528 [Trifolium repens]|nr:hypothetical protein QL285_044528 [Trifolium repens]
MDKADHSSALRITNFNHEKECKFKEDMIAAVSESVRRSVEAAKRLDEEESAYVSLVEAEFKKRVEEEALKVFVERATRIDEVETQKLLEAQTMGPQQGEDTIMSEQEEIESTSDKGKTVIVDATPLRSPVRPIPGSPSSAIPSAVQMPLEEMKNEMREELRNEIYELRADMRTAMNASTEATHKKIDEMMLFLQKLASQLPKP